MRLRGRTGAFSVLEFGFDDDPDIVFLENASDDVSLIENDRVAIYRESFSMLLERALSPADSMKLLEVYRDRFSGRRETVQ